MCTLRFVDPLIHNCIANASGFPQALYREAIGIARLKGLQEQVDSERARLGKISEEVERSEETSRSETQVGGSLSRSQCNPGG